MISLTQSRRAVVAVCLGTTLLPGTACAQSRHSGPSGAPLIPLEELFGNPEITAGQLAPDGRTLAFLKPYQGKLNVWVKPLEGGRERRLTHDTVRAIPVFWWNADGTRILYLQDRGGDESYHLFVADLDTPGSAALDLTPFGGVEVDLFAAPTTSPDTVLITMNRRDPRLADAYRVSLSTGQLELAAQNRGDFLGYVADAHNRVRIAYALDSLGRYSLWTRPREYRRWRRVAQYPVQDKITPLRFHPDGKRLYVLSDHGGDLARLVLIDLASGEESVVDEDPLKEADLDEARFDEETGELLATVYVGDTARVYPKTAEVRRVLSAARARRAGTVELGTVSRDRSRWLFRVSSPTDPGGTYVWKDGDAEPTLMYEPNPRLARYRFAPTRPIQYRASDGMLIHGYLTLPADREPRSLPLVVLVHGGPWSRDYWQFNAEVQFLASRGYAVLQVNDRGEVGCGKQFPRAARGEFARAMHTDLLDGVRWAIDQGLVDPDRIAIMGASYGGYAALVGLTFTPDVFACAVDYAGPSDLVTLLESFPPSWAPFLPRAWYPFVGDPRRAEDRQDMLRRSPLLRVDSARAPLLIFQGTNDPRVTQDQSDRVALALHRRDIPVTYLLAGNEGHGWGQRETALAVNRATELFLSKCLGGSAQASVSSDSDAALAQLTVDLDSLARERR
ncbi:S9 family peptidase [soil metagenome]